MAVLRIDIERALDELISQEEGMRFQGLAVVLGKMSWPELIAHERKKDLGLDAYAEPSQTPERVGKGLAASITPTLKKVSDDAGKAKKNFPDLRMLLFVTAAKVGNTDRRKWKEAIQNDHGIELQIIGREDIIKEMMMPKNARLCASFLHLDIDPEPRVADLTDRTRRAAGVVARNWGRKTEGHPLIDLTAVRLDPDGAESDDVLSLEQIAQALLQSRRVVLDGPAGSGKTTTLMQLAQRLRIAGTPFMIDLPAWTSSRRGILDYIAGQPAFQKEGLTSADLARVHQPAPFLLLLNGWNEIAESCSGEANHALRELERDFPCAGIIVATRAHRLTPPLPGAMRLRLRPLRRVQREAYLAARLGANCTALRVRIDADPSLDELTRSPFILSEVTSLIEAGSEIPSTKLDMLEQILRLQEQREEHRNALQSSPVYGRQTEYLKALATEMTGRGAVALNETDARRVVAAAERELADSGQVGLVGAPAILATLTAHHVLVRVDYPQTAFRFEHQRFQEYYAALDVRSQLLDLRDDDRDAIGRFATCYVDNPAWAEPLRMIADTFAKHTGDGETVKRVTCVGQKLVGMALAIDPVFAGELAQLCGAAVWKSVRSAVGDRLRRLYATHDGSFRQYALAGMLATGSGDFGDIIVPLLSGGDRQTRLRTYRLWPGIQISSLGANWREQARGWSDDARADLVSELLHHRVDDEIAAFAAEDDSAAVKKSAVSSLIWVGAEDALIRVLASMDAEEFADVARMNADRMPAEFKSKTIAALRTFVESTSDQFARLQTAIDLIELGETGLDGVVKDALTALSGEGVGKADSYHIQPAIEYLRRTDPVWASEWVAAQVAEGVLYGHEYWMRFATSIPEHLAERYLHRLETEDLRNRDFGGMIAVIAACADVSLAVRVFTKLRELRSKVEAEPGVRHDLEWKIMNQLEAVFRRLPDDVAAAGVLSSVTNRDPLDLRVASGLLSRVATSDVDPLCIADAELKARLRAYVKDSIDLVLHRDDFNGAEKAALASAIAQIGEPEDMADLVTLMRADIDRMRRGRAAREAGDRGPCGSGGSESYAVRHIASAMHLDPAGAEQVLIDLLSEPEYRSETAAAMARGFLPVPEGSFGRTFRYDLIWTARENPVPPPGDDLRRARFAAALNGEIGRLLEQPQDGKPARDLKELARALAAVDPCGSAGVVVDAIVLPGRWDQSIRLDAAERLLLAGVVLPTTTALALVDSILGQTENWTQNSDRYVLRRCLALCAFVDEPAAGISKIREVLDQRLLPAYELREIVTALGESRSAAAFDLLYELASDGPTFEQYEDGFVSAFAALDTPRSRELLVAFVDPDLEGGLIGRPHHQGMLVVRLAELALRAPEVAARLTDLCERDLPAFNRAALSKVMVCLGTAEALAANLKLIDDGNPMPVPQGVWDQIESEFVEREPCGSGPNVFTEHARAANELRVRLLRMAIKDERRRKSAFTLLGRIEERRLMHGRPPGEPRHPDLASGRPWPPC